MDQAAHAVKKQNVDRFGSEHRYHLARPENGMRHDLSGTIGSRLTVRITGFAREFLHFR
jgi:hypothetical protein